MKNPIPKYKPLLQSITIFFGWLLIIYTVIFFIPAVWLLFFMLKSPMPGKVLGISAIITLIGLLMLGLFTIREKTWNFIGWAALSIALSILLFSLQNGIQLIWLVLATGLIALVSYYSLASHQKQFPSVAIIIGIIFLAVFASHAVILSAPQRFGLKIQGNELEMFAREESLRRAIEIIDPVEFVKDPKGREIAVQVYNTSPLISQEKLERMVKENPRPLIKEIQQSLLSTEKPLTNNPYNHILNVYMYPLINFLGEEVKNNN